MASKYKTQKGPRWRATWTDNGKQCSKGGYRTETEAAAYEGRMRQERELEHMGEAGIEQRARTTRLCDWLLIWWEHHSAAWTQLTREDYADAVNALIDPYIGNVKLYALTGPRIARWRDDMLADGVTVRSVIQAMRTLSSALSQAKERGYVTDNWAKGISKPSPGPGRPVDPLAPTEVERIRHAILVRPRRGRFDDIDALSAAAQVSILAYGGLRPSERTALRVCDIDFASGGLWVRGVVAGEYRENDTKTHTLGRFVDMPAAVMDELAAYIAARGLTGRQWLFPDETGGVSRWTHRNWTARVWRPAKGTAGEGAPDVVSAGRILGTDPYDLRHSCVSVIARAEGADLDWAALAARMGHSVEVMRSTYLHVVNAQKRRSRIPVEEQIAEARAALGVDLAASALHERLSPVAAARPKLIDMQAVRAARRAS
jgi:integrase